MEVKTEHNEVYKDDPKPYLAEIENKVTISRNMHIFFVSFFLLLYWCTTHIYYIYQCYRTNLFHYIYDL